MPELHLRYYCYVCGHVNDLKPDVPLAPKMAQTDVTCEKCGDGTHVLTTACPECQEVFRYFLSDLDFPVELQTLAKTYVGILSSVKDSLSDYVKEFNVPVPKRWSVQLKCTCGHEYVSELPLPQL
ncbi:MAG: hypothetical protein RTU30_06125 [Candidatus Thorarchaeota archaeon]